MSISTKQNTEAHTLKSDIQDVYDSICKAFSEMDIDAVLGYFADHEDMVKISNGLVFRGKKQLADGWRRRLENISGLRIRIDNIQVHRIDENHAWATADEYISVDEHTQKAIVSNIFISVESEWKILLDHTTYVPSEITGSAFSLSPRAALQADFPG